MAANGFRYPGCPNVIASMRWRWVIGELRMPFRRLFPSKPIALSPYLYGSYRPPKQRWWPLFACLGAGGVFVLSLLGPPQQSDGANSTRQPLVYSVTRSQLVTVRPAVEERARAPAVVDKPADNPTTASPEIAIANVHAPTRGKAHSEHLSKRRASAHRYAARKPRGQEVLSYGRYVGSPWGRYGLTSSRNGGWSFN
jgi:hypothetical protein